MSLNSTPAANRTHIAFFGKRNAGKSSLLNAVTDQEIAVVSDVKGTTTDPVYKTMELLPIGPVMLIDTPGFDDEGYLGELRIKKTRLILNKTDIAVLVVDSSEKLNENDSIFELLDLIKSKNIPCVVVYNKIDSASENYDFTLLGDNFVKVSALTRSGIENFKNVLGNLAKTSSISKPIVSDLISAGDVVIMVTPIDSAAPKGRLILPQQLVLRDIIDSDAIAVVVKENQLSETFEKLSSKPALVITDSQVFDVVDKLTPSDVPITSFSILMARYKGFLETSLRGIAALENIKNGDKILIAEGCTHHRQCGDIGTIKIPAWLKKHTSKEFTIETSSGGDFPEDLSKYSLIIHCGGCMLNEREVLYRMKCANDANIPFINYGTAIAQMKGILQRSVQIFSDCNEIRGDNNE
ncbi:MAG: [FeFe] hydrogenase H-cluster maturation GTPase HydF [Ruminococcaceae bacterium]|nr:[FeFe] hydrogenase H-cluster maturation GTPase HydF [Oscillospiraceae bacterium]